MRSSFHEVISAINLLVWRSCVALFAVLPAGPVVAQAPDTSNWTCQRCPFRTGYAANYAASASYLSDDAAHFGDATGYDEQGSYLTLDADGSLDDDGRQIRWHIEDLGLDSRVLGIEGGKQGRYGYSLEYRALPRRQFDTTQTVFSATGPNLLKLPDDWVRAGATPGFGVLGENLSNLDIESDRETLKLGGSLLATYRLDLFADYRHTRRNGSNMQGAAFYTNASLIPRPFEYMTDELDAGVRFRGDRSNVKLAYYGSYFDNDSSRLSWENPFMSSAGAETAALARSPDSSFQQLLVSGDFRPGRYAATFTYSAAAGIMEQDSAFLNYSTNPGVLAALPPGTSLDGRVATRNVAMTASLRPYSRLRLKAAYRHDERDNRTPVEQWDRIIAETFNSGELTANSPYSFERRSLSLSADYDLSQRFRVSVGHDNREVVRDYQEVALQEEVSGWGQLTWRPNAVADLRTRAGTERRRAGEYNTILAQSLGQNPLLRKYHLAYRFRRFAELTLAISLPNRPIYLGGTLRVTDDSYTQSELGLLASEDRRLAFDFTWSFAEASSFYLLLAFDQIDSEQAGSERFALPDWRANIDDEFRSFGAGLSVDSLTEQLSFTIDYTYGLGNSATDVSATSERPGRFPGLRTGLHSLRMQLEYDMAERLQGSLELRYQRFKVEDWALAGVGPATLPNVLTLGASPYDYNLVLIGVGVRYSLGN